MFFRDTKEVLNVLMIFWFWFTPIFYPPELVPEGFRLVLGRESYDNCRDGIPQRGFSRCRRQVWNTCLFCWLGQGFCLWLEPYSFVIPRQHSRTSCESHRREQPFQVFPSLREGPRTT